MLLASKSTVAASGPTRTKVSVVTAPVITNPRTRRSFLKAKPGIMLGFDAQGGRKVRVRRPASIGVEEDQTGVVHGEFGRTFSLLIFFLLVLWYIPSNNRTLPRNRLALLSRGPARQDDARKRSVVGRPAQLTGTMQNHGSLNWLSDLLICPKTKALPRCF